jgi:diaminopimelate epimerase
MKLHFTKMHGAGNDFIVIDATTTPVNFSREQWRQLADRRFGIGADQILLVEASEDPSCDFRYRIFNSDGGEVEHCGNGSRAFVKFVTARGLTAKTSIRVETMSGIINPRLERDGSVTVDMNAPILEAGKVPFTANGLAGVAVGDDLAWPVALADGSTPLLSVVSMGNPHAVQVVDDVDSAPVASRGALVEHNAHFPNKVNAGFMQLMDRHHIKLRVWERAAGETLACGTGSCAAVVAGIRRGLLDSPVRVSARGGELSIAWAGPGQSVYMTGPAVAVFEGEIEV